MSIANIAGARQRLLLCNQVQLSKDYSLEISLYDFGSSFQIEVIWDPKLPNEKEFAKLSHLVELALLPFHLRVFELSGLIGSEQK